MSGGPRAPEVVSELHAGGYRLPVYAVRRAPEIGAGTVRRVPVIVAGGGLAGLSCAADLASRGVPVLLLDEDDTVGVRGASSRGIAYARKTLEIFARLGVQGVREKGVTWSVGRTLDGDRELFRFDLAAGSRSSQPPFVNIQQFYVEAALVQRACALGVEIRWKNAVRGLQVAPDHVRLAVATPHGDYAIEADWLVDATGVHSPLREAAGIALASARGLDRWCICDVRFETRWPCERWTWTRAPFNGGRAVWQHPLPDEVWRLDYQLPEDDDGPIDAAKARAMVAAHVGAQARFEVVWAGPWSYRTQLAETFRRGPVFLVGDAAHAFSPFGGRGGNSGVQDAENLAWKLALVVRGEAPAALLDTYSPERRTAAQHNIEVTEATMRFLKPPTRWQRLLRDAVLAGAHRFAFLRARVNTGKMSMPFTYPPGPGVRQGGQALPDLQLRGAGGTLQLLADLTAGPVAGLVLDFCGDRAASEALRAELAQLAPGLRFRRLVAEPQGEELWDDPALRSEAQVAPRGDAALLLRPDGHVAAVAAGDRRGEIVEAVREMLCVPAAAREEGRGRSAAVRGIAGEAARER